MDLLKPALVFEWNLCWLWKPDPSQVFPRPSIECKSSGWFYCWCPGKDVNLKTTHFITFKCFFSNLNAMTDQQGVELLRSCESVDGCDSAGGNGSFNFPPNALIWKDSHTFQLLTTGWSTQFSNLWWMQALRALRRSLRLKPPIPLISGYDPIIKKWYPTCHISST